MFTPIPGGALDVVTQLRFSPTNDLIVSTWDSVLVYDVHGPPKQVVRLQSDVPVLSIAFSGQSTVLGLLDGLLRTLDYENMRLSGPTANGGISSGINNILVVDNLLVTTTIGGRVQWLDPRSLSPVNTYTSPHKIFAMDSTTTQMCLGMSGRRIEIFDHRRWDEPCQIRDSGLKYQIKDIKCTPDGEAYAVASIDGRVSLEFFDPSPDIQANRFAFKCHRQKLKESGEEEAYPVNALKFQRTPGRLFTAGSDGHLCLWNWHKRKRTKQYPTFGAPVVCVDSNHNDSRVAVATSDDSYLLQQDLLLAKPAKSSKIFVHTPTDS